MVMVILFPLSMKDEWWSRRLLCLKTNQIVAISERLCLKNISYLKMIVTFYLSQGFQCPIICCHFWKPAIKNTPSCPQFEFPAQEWFDLGCCYRSSVRHSDRTAGEATDLPYHRNQCRTDGWMLLRELKWVDVNPSKRLFWVHNDGVFVWVYVFLSNWWSILICWDDFLDECRMILGERWWDGSDSFSVFLSREALFFALSDSELDKNCFRRSYVLVVG